MSEQIDKASMHHLAAKTAFRVTGVRNVKLETIKRGEDDDALADGHKTIILRLYEHFGGHAQATIKM